MSFRVSWAIDDIQADCDREAAEYALALLRSKNSGCLMFDVTDEDTGKEIQIDLEEE